VRFVREDRQAKNDPAQTCRADLPGPVHLKTVLAAFDKAYRFGGKQIATGSTPSVLK
jgi:hypothetical protein